MPTGKHSDTANPISAEKTAAHHSLMLKIDPPKIIDLIISFAAEDAMKLEDA
jgi:hypothetical protein